MRLVSLQRGRGRVGPSRRSVVVREILGIMAPRKLRPLVVLVFWGREIEVRDEGKELRTVYATWLNKNSRWSL